LNLTVYPLNKLTRSKGGDTVTAIFGMMAMMPVLFASAGYVLVSSGGTGECKGCKADD
jgi:hypothetical protein